MGVVHEGEWPSVLSPSWRSRTLRQLLPVLACVLVGTLSDSPLMHAGFWHRLLQRGNNFRALQMLPALSTTAAGCAGTWLPELRVLWCRVGMDQD